MSMTNRPIAVEVSNDSDAETKSFPHSWRFSIISMKFREFRWIRSILMTRRASHWSRSAIIFWYAGRRMFRPEWPSSTYRAATDQSRARQYASRRSRCASREKPSLAWSSVDTLV